MTDIAVIAAIAAFFIGMAIGVHQTVNKWHALVKASNANVARYRLMFFESAEKYWRTRAQLAEVRKEYSLIMACTQNADDYKRSADELRPEVSP